MSLLYRFDLDEKLICRIRLIERIEPKFMKTSRQTIIIYVVLNGMNK